MPTLLRPDASAAASVVPVPANGSRTRRPVHREHLDEPPRQLERERGAARARVRDPRGPAARRRGPIQTSENQTLRSSQKKALRRRAAFSSALVERALAALPEDQDVLVLVRHVGAGGQHSRAHELVRGVRRLPPEDVRKRREARARHAEDDAGVVREEPEVAAGRPRRVADVDARDAARGRATRQHSAQTRSSSACIASKAASHVARSEASAIAGASSPNDAVPHLDHGVRRRRDDEVDRRVGDAAAARARRPRSTRWLVTNRSSPRGTRARGSSTASATAFPTTAAPAGVKCQKS